MQPSQPARPSHGLRNMAILNVVLLSIQAWTGDVINLFSVFPSGPVSSMGQFFSALAVAGPGPIASFHALEGVLVLLIFVGITVTSFIRSKSRNLRVVAVIGLISVLFAAIGGYEFVLSGFLNNGNSAQMGGSFILAYAMSFMVLYYLKQ